MTAIAELLKAIAALLWPILAFYAIYKFKKEIGDLLSRVRKAKVFGSEFEVDPRGIALSAERKADAALASLSSTKRLQLAETTPANLSELSALASEYDRVRAGPTGASGASAEVSELVGRMIRSASGVTDFDVVKAITSRSAGERMTAYAYIYEHPAAEYLALVVAALADGEPTGNGQYWAIQALARVYPLAAPQDRRESEVVLRTLLSRYSSDSDRYYALRKVLGPLWLDLRKPGDT